MALGFHPDRYVAFPGDCAIMLDVAADRYRRLSKPLSAGLADFLAGPVPPETTAALLAQGILVDGVGARPRAFAATARLLKRPSDGLAKPAGAGFAVSARALVGARWQLRFAGLKRGLTAAAHRARQTQIDETKCIAACVQRFERHRTWLPMAPHCLPDGLALHAVLRRQGIAARLIIGVRDQPFAAHCWVEAHDQVLNDPLAIVAELTPILVL